MVPPGAKCEKGAAVLKIIPDLKGFDRQLSTFWIFLKIM